MFAVAQLPMVDLRTLGPQQLGRLKVPDWNADDPGDVFIRGFGEVHTRISGGFPGARGERFYCDFNRAARIRAKMYLEPDREIELKPWFRRFYFDGLFCGRFEFGFLIQDEDEKELFVNPYHIDALSLLRTIAELPVTIRGIDIPDEEVPMAESCKQLGLAYLSATTQRQALTQFPILETYGSYLRVGPLSLYFRLSNGLSLSPSRAWRMIASQGLGTLYVTTHKTSAGRFQAVVQESDSGALEESATERAVRVLFSYLNALFFAASHCVNETEVHVSSDTLKSLLLDTIQRFQNFKATAPFDETDPNFTKALRVFSRVYGNRSEQMLARLKDLSDKMHKPSASKRFLLYLQKLFEESLQTAVEATVSGSFPKPM